MDDTDEELELDVHDVTPTRHFVYFDSEDEESFPSHLILATISENRILAEYSAAGGYIHEGPEHLKGCVFHWVHDTDLAQGEV